MSGRETLGVAAASFMFSLAAYVTMVLWIIGPADAEIFGRVLIAMAGIFIVPGSTAAITAIVVTNWSEDA